jgi:hypothetical protein
MTKYVSKAKDRGHLVIYCVERNDAHIANASFLLATFLLIVEGKTAMQAAERFTGSSAPYILAAFRDASFNRQVAPQRNLFPCKTAFTIPATIPRPPQWHPLMLRRDCAATLAGLRPDPPRLPRGAGEGGAARLVRSVHLRSGKVSGCPCTPPATPDAHVPKQFHPRPHPATHLA